MDIKVFKKEKGKKNIQACSYYYATKNIGASFFEIHKIEDAVKCDVDLIDKAHINHFYLIIWITKGNGRFFVDFKEQKVHDDTIFFISPGQLIRFAEMNEGIGFGITFSEDFLNNTSETLHKQIKNDLFGSFRIASITSFIDEDAKAKAKTKIKMLFDEFYNGKNLYGNKEELGALFSSFIISLKRNGVWNIVNEGQSQNDYSHYIDFINLVENNYKEQHELNWYVDNLSISIGTLKKSVKNIVGNLPMQVLNERIILEAKRLLCNSPELKIKQVADSLGFKDPSNFVKFFKRIEGISPGDFRELD